MTMFSLNTRINTTRQSARPFPPLVLDDASSLEAMAGAVMRLHNTLLAPE